ncbi:hypothetical protein EON65_00640 [archaeon]|nr:MAG: hypothetical protein EON65_00640 [archaeon]
MAMLHDAPQVTVLHGDDIPCGFTLPNNQTPQFYAAASIFIKDVRVGTVAIIDFAARDGFNEQSFDFLKTIADTVSEVLDERHQQDAVLQPSYHITESMMLYVKNPLLQLTHASSSLQAALLAFGATHEERQLAELTSCLDVFKKGCSLLDDVIRNGLQLSLLLLEHMSADKKKDYFNLLQSNKYAHRMTISQELEKTFKSILPHTSISNGSYNDNIMSYYWSNGLQSDTLQSRRNSLNSSSRDSTITVPAHAIRRSLSRTMLDLLSSDSHDTKRGLTVMTGREICLDRVIVWSTLYTLLVSQQDSWDHVQLSVGIVHHDSDVINTVLMKLTFLNAKLSDVSVNEDEVLQLLRATLRCIGGEVRRAEFMSDVMCQYEVSMPGYIEESMFSPRPPSLSCGSCEIKYSHKRQAVSSSNLFVERQMVIPKPVVDTVDENSRGSAKSSLKSSKLSHSNSKANGFESSRGSSKAMNTETSTHLPTEQYDGDLYYYNEQELAMMLDNSLTPLTAIPGSGQASVASLYTSCMCLDELDQVVKSSVNVGKKARNYRARVVARSIFGLFSGAYSRAKTFIYSATTSPSRSKKVYVIPNNTS